MITGVGINNTKYTRIEFGLENPDSLENVTKKIIHLLNTFTDKTFFLKTMGNDGIYRSHAKVFLKREIKLPIGGMGIHKDAILTYIVTCPYTDIGVTQKYEITKHKIIAPSLDTVTKILTENKYNFRAKP